MTLRRTTTQLPSDDGGPLRAALMHVEDDEGTVGLPPNELLPEGSDNGSYGVFLRMLKSTTRILQETAVYRIASDGAFVHRQIETEEQIFFFRSPASDLDETPYASLWKYR